MDADRQQHIEQVIADFDVLGRTWSNLMVYDVVGGNYASLSQYLKARRAGATQTEAVAIAEAEAAQQGIAPLVSASQERVAVVAPAPPVPVPPLAAAREAWTSALRAVAAYAQSPRPRGRVEDAAYQVRGVVLQRQMHAAETRWRPLEMQARNAQATYLAHQAQLGRGDPAEQARCQEAMQVSRAALRLLVGDVADPLSEVQALLVPPVIDGRPLLPPLL